MTLSHGNADFHLEGNVLHTYPKSAFNEYGIHNYQIQVLAQKPSHSHWILFEHPQTDAGLTPQALERLENAYLCFINQGCCAIVCESHSIFSTVVEEKVLSQLSIPCLVSNNQDALIHFIEQYS